MHVLIQCSKAQCTLKVKQRQAQKVYCTGLVVVTVVVSRSEHTLLQKEGKERKEFNTLFAISSGQKSTRSRIRKVVLGFAAQLWGIQSMYCIMTTPLTTVLAFTHCFGFKTAFQAEATDDFYHWWNQQTHAIFFKCRLKNETFLFNLTSRSRTVSEV